MRRIQFRRTFSFHSSLSNLKLKILISIKLFRSNSKLLDNSSFGNLSKLNGGLQGELENQENSALHIETILGIKSICWPFIISAGYLLIQHFFDNSELVLEFMMTRDSKKYQTLLSYFLRNSRKIKSALPPDKPSNDTNVNHSCHLFK